MSKITHFASKPDAFEQLRKLFLQMAETLDEDERFEDAANVRKVAEALHQLRQLAYKKFRSLDKARAAGMVRSEALPLESRLARVAAYIHFERVWRPIYDTCVRTADIIEHDKSLTLAELNLLLHHLTDSMRELSSDSAPAESRYARGASALRRTG